MSIMLIALAGCSTTTKFDEVGTKVSPALLHPGDPIPLPQGDATLTVTGKIGTTNTENAIIMDIATIEQVGLVEYTVEDLFEQRPILYQGVLMRDLLALWQVDAAAQRAHFVALNDYTVEIALAEFRDYPILFALKADGNYMQPADRGPAMIVYPLADYEFDLPLIQWNWIWQIKSIEIR